MKTRRLSALIRLIGYAVLLFALYGCTGAPAPTPTPAGQNAIRAAWRSSPHGNTYDLGKGPNTYCARCHSPRNWDPAARIDPAPNCVSCKFAFDPAPRRAAGNPLVPANEWKDIGCEICHPMENGIASKQVAWLNTATGKYEAVATVNDLCDKCHADTEVLRHKRDLGSSAHVGWSCVACHDAHTTKASCTSSACHGPLFATKATPIAGHDAAHQSVQCVACHDASGLEIGSAAGTSQWTTLRTTELLGRSTAAPYQSHNVQRKVDCARCHFPGNPWKLTESVSSK